MSAAVLSAGVVSASADSDDLDAHSALEYSVVQLCHGFLPYGARTVPRPIFLIK
jgi:hypothetical protein